MYFCVTRMRNSDLLESVSENFVMRVPRRQIIHNFVNKLRNMWPLIHKKQKYKCQVPTEKKLDDTGARFEHTPRKSLKCLAQETGASKSSTRMITQLVKLSPYKTTIIHALQPRNPASRVHFCSWFLQSVIKCEIDLQLIFFLMKHSFTCRDT
jgi:hypothetical protein